MFRHLGCLLLALCLLCCSCMPALAEMAKTEAQVQLTDDETAVEQEALPPEAGEQLDPTARNDLINRIISMGEQLYTKAAGRPQRAHYKKDIYVCKNFTTYLFNQNKSDFRMNAYPHTKLLIPNNLPADKCRPYAYGYAWQEIPAEKGNPFYAAARFLYDTELSEEENMALALEFLKKIQRGDFFQMTASYSAGTGAHSAIMIADYDPETGKLTWMDSNMRGTRKAGIRYGYVQYQATASIEWWAEAFCQKKRGATIYRLRSDIIYKDDVR